jgi:oligosaccharide repeat unit polymerase
MLKVLYYISLFSSICYSVLTFSALDIWMVSEGMLIRLVLSCLFLGLSIIFGCFAYGLKRRFTLFAYTLSFIVFNLGYYIVNLYSNGFGVFVYGYTSHISYQSEAIGFFVIYCGMTAYFVSYMVSNFSVKTKSLQNANLHKQGSNSVRFNYAQRFVKWTMYISSIFAFTKMFLAIIQVQRFGYSSLYTNISGYSLPILDLFDSFFVISFFCYLAIMPSPKNLRTPVLIFITYSALTLLYGKRGVFLIGVLTVVWYFMKRDDMKIDIKEFVSKGRLMILGICGVALAYFMLVFSQIRLGFGGSSDNVVESNGLLYGLVKIIEQLGLSGRIVPLSVEYANAFDISGKQLFLFYPVLNYIQNNVLSRTLDLGYDSMATVEYLMRSYNFGGWITYIVRPESFLNGGGIGTNYLAEAYIAFGFAGVTIVNIILGFLLARMDNVRYWEWRFNALFLNVFSLLVFMPRSSALGIIPANFSFIAYIFIVSLIIGIRKGRG